MPEKVAKLSSNVQAIAAMQKQLSSVVNEAASMFARIKEVTQGIEQMKREHSSASDAATQ